MSDAPTPLGPTQLPAEIPSTSEDRTMALLAHLGGIVFGFLPALIIWLIKKDQSAFINDQGKEALNFQITMVIYFVVSVILMLVTCGIGFFFPIGVYVFNLVLCILAGIESNKGKVYRYPLTLRLIK